MKISGGRSLGRILDLVEPRDCDNLERKRGA